MTIPDERTRAVMSAKAFLYDLLNPLKTPRVPLGIRMRARSILKHFPGHVHMDQSSKRYPSVWGKPEEESNELLKRKNR